MRADFWVLVFVPRDPFVTAALAAITPNLNLRHWGDIFPVGI